MKNLAYKLPVAVAGATVVLVGGFALSQTPPQEPQEDSSLLASLGFVPLATEQGDTSEEQDVVSGDVTAQRVSVVEVAKEEATKPSVQEEAPVSEAVSIYEVPEDSADLEKMKAELEVLKKDKEERDAAKRAQEEAKRTAEEAAEKERRDTIMAKLNEIKGFYYNPTLSTDNLEGVLAGAQKWQGETRLANRIAQLSKYSVFEKPEDASKLRDMTDEEFKDLAALLLVCQQDFEKNLYVLYAQLWPTVDLDQLRKETLAGHSCV